MIGAIHGEGEWGWEVSLPCYGVWCSATEYGAVARCPQRPVHVRVDNVNR